MTDDFQFRSFDDARPRPAPRSLTGHWLGGAPVSIELTSLTIVIAIKTDCDGCRDIVNARRDRVAGLETIVVSASDELDEQWARSRSSILVAPQLLEQLDVRWPPFYVVVDPASSSVVTEGVVLDLEQVEREVTSFLSR